MQVDSSLLSHQGSPRRPLGFSEYLLVIYRDLFLWDYGDFVQVHSCGDIGFFNWLQMQVQKHTVSFPLSRDP